VVCGVGLIQWQIQAEDGRKQCGQLVRLALIIAIKFVAYCQLNTLATWRFIHKFA
jgi:hypothetical protein